MKNGLVILNYNDSESVINTVDRIRDYCSIQEIIIVDNHSTDNSYSILDERYRRDGKIHLLDSGWNGGYAYGNNIGAKYAIEVLKVDYITVANPDVFFSDEVLSKMVEVCGSRSDVGCVSACMQTLSRNNLPTAWKLPMMWDCLYENCHFLNKVFGRRVDYSEKYYKENILAKVDVISGAFFAMDAKTFIECGLLDEDTFLYYEENILAYRLKRLQKSNYLITNLKYEHFISRTISFNMRVEEKYKELAISRKVYLRKYMKANKIQLILQSFFDDIGLIEMQLYSLIARKMVKNGEK